MCDEDVINKLHRLAGVGKVYYEPNKNHKPAWNWVLFRQADVKAFLVRILPYLGYRRACRALDAIDYFDNCYNVTEPSLQLG